MAVGALIGLGTGAAAYEASQKQGLITSASKNVLNISQLLPGSAFSEDTTIIKQLKSLNKIRLAKPGDKDIALVLLPSPDTDYNGALGIKSLKETSESAWTEISEKYPIHFEEVSTEPEVHAVAKKIKQTFGNIKILEINGHGDEQIIVLSPHHTFTGSHPLPIDPDGVLILHSCFAGVGGIKNRNNLANKLALQHVGVKVVSYTKSSKAFLQVIDVVQRIFKFINFLQWDITYQAQACKNPLSNTTDLYPATCKNPLSKTTDFCSATYSS